MGATYELSATLREKVGKGAARSVRRQDQIPAVIYGGNKPPITISLPRQETFLKIHGGGFYTTVATIAVNGEKIRVIPRDFQLDPVSDRPLHVDFMRVQAGSKITVEVPVQFINDTQAPGIKRGGVLNVVRHRVALVCPVDSIPERIVADLTGLEINDSLHISAIPLPEGVRPAIRDRDFTVATVAAPAGVKEEMRALAEAAAAAKAAAEAAAAAGTEPGAEGAAAAPAEGGTAPAAGAAAAGGKAAPAAAGAKPAPGAAPAGGGKK
jgi:large subunit ribosomal protein L25